MFETFGFEIKKEFDYWIHFDFDALNFANFEKKINEKKTQIAKKTMWIKRKM